MTTQEDIINVMEEMQLRGYGRIEDVGWTQLRDQGAEWNPPERKKKRMEGL
jgi:hypothetical protein